MLLRVEGLSGPVCTVKHLSAKLFRPHEENAGPSTPRLRRFAQDDKFTGGGKLEEGTTGTTAAGDGGDDGEFVGCGDGGGFFGGEVAEVFVVKVDVDEGAELALVVEELL